MARRAALACALALCLTNGTAQAAGNLATASGEATATIIAPVTVVQVSDLDFGTITGGLGQSGTVTIIAGGGTVYGGNARAVCGSSGCEAPHPARFAVTGEAGRGYVVSAPTSIQVAGTTTTGATAPTLTIDALTIRTDSRPAGDSTGTLASDGTDGFTVGGTLNLPPDAIPARYSAWFPVLVSYG